MTIRTRIAVTGPLLFGDTFDEVGSATMRLESHYVDVSETGQFDREHGYGVFYWLSGCPADTFEAAHQRDDDVADLLSLAANGGEFYRTRTNPLPRPRRPVVQRVAEHDMSITSGRRTSGVLTVSLLCPSRRSLDRLFADLRAAGFDVEVKRLLMGDDYAPKAVLTSAQRETLELAYEQGYYRIPRETSLMDLATELQISDQACSERLRRGIQRLLAEEFD